MNFRRSILVVLSFLVISVVITGILLMNADRGETLFHGKSENKWIQELAYSDSNQVDLWRGLGADGVAVLMRGWERSQRPWSKSYRKTYGNIRRNTPGWFVKMLPAPKKDVTLSSRMRIIRLLSSLSKDAMEALPTMIDALSDENLGVRALAVTYFTSGEDDQVLLNQLKTTQRERILTLFLDSVGSTRNMSLRNNVMLALRYFPEEKEKVIPILVEGMKDSDTHVRMVAVISLVKLDKQQANFKGAVPVAIHLLHHTDDQIASRIAQLMVDLRFASLQVVPALLVTAQSESALLANESIRSLGHFSDQAAEIIPVLKKLQQAKEKTASAKLIQKTIQSLESGQTSN